MINILLILFAILGIFSLITLYVCMKITIDISRMEEELEGAEIDE